MSFWVLEVAAVVVAGVGGWLKAGSDAGWVPIGLFALAVVLFGAAELVRRGGRR